MPAMRISALESLCSLKAGASPHKRSAADLSNLYCLHAQTQRGLVSDTSDQGNSVISHLIEVREIGVGDRTNEGHFVGLRADCGLVLNNVPDLHILQLPEVGMTPSVVAEQTNIPGVEARRTVMAGAL